MKTKNELTPMQSKAIKHGKGNALVSASAGSGKTFVVIERIIRLILEEKVSISEILAITFTKLAASEMKDKLKGALTKKYLETGDVTLKSQLDLINNADISTIDALCSKIVKKYFYLIGVDANFSVLEDSKKKILQDLAIDSVFDTLYEEKDSEFLSLIPIFSNGRSDRGLKKVVKELCSYCEAEDGFESIKQKTINTYENAFELATSEFKPKILSLAEKYLEDFTYLRDCFVEDKVRHVYCDVLANAMSLLLKTDDYFSFFNKFNKIDLSLPRTKCPDGEYRAVLSEVVTAFKKNFKSVITVFNVNVEEEKLRLKNSLSLVLGLINLTYKYKLEYEKLKAEENAYDFADVESFCLTLLRREDIQTEIKNTYKYVFVDEYQDVNAVQEEMISLITNDNAFLVGDSKQSIYAFRGCNPLYFKQKNDEYQSGSGTVIPLDNNFRSSNSVITAVNDIFSRIMKEDFGGTDYSKNLMVYGNGYEGEGETKIHVIAKPKKEEEQLPTREIYSVMNATELKEDEDVSAEVKKVLNLVSQSLLSKYYDVKEKRYKDVEFKDVCILLRSIGCESSLGEKIVHELIKNGVPVSSTVKKSIGEYPEIKVLVNLVSVLVCADRDVPLATVMLNLYNFSEDELCSIRETGGLSSKISFYSCVKTFSRGNNDLSKKCAEFLSWLSQKRLIAEFLPISEVLTEILNESGYLAKNIASPFGEARQKRIERFIAEGVVGGKKLRLNEFEEHIDSVLEDLTLSESSGDNTVKVMTMHASKGLEFPIVIVAGVGKQFNDSDSKKAIVKDRELGLSVKYFNDGDMTYTENIVRHLMKYKLKKVLAVEELRLFYVALTRAKYALHITVNGELKDEFDVYSVNKMSDFITSDNPLIEYYDSVESEYNFKKKGTSVAGKEVSAKLTESIVESLSYKYPYANEIDVPVKSSVSDVNKAGDEEYFETTKEFGHSSAENGTAYHRFFELIDFYNYNGEKDLESFVEKGLMSKEQAGFIDANKVERILKLPIFNEIKDCNLYKERKFCHLIPASEVLNVNSSESVLIQGIADLIAVKNGEAILVDYKLSTIQNESDLVKAYSTQMKLYKNAIEKILGVKVKKVALLNVLQEKIVEV